MNKLRKKKLKKKRRGKKRYGRDGKEKRKISETQPGKKEKRGKRQ